MTSIAESEVDSSRSIQVGPSSRVCQIQNLQVHELEESSMRRRRWRRRRPQALNVLFTAVFAVELVLNAYAHWLRDFFTNGWYAWSRCLPLLVAF